MPPAIIQFNNLELPVWPIARLLYPASLTGAPGFNHSITGTVTQPTGVPITPVPFPDLPDTAPPANNNRTDVATASGATAIAKINTEKTTVTSQLTAVGALLPASTATLTTVAPATGSVNGGTALTLTGTGFNFPVTGPTTVTVGGAPATAVVVVSATSITCVAPRGQMPGITGVTVTGPTGNAYRPNSFTYQ